MSKIKNAITRSTSTSREKQRDQGLDLVRFVAILFVLLLHSTHVTTSLPPAVHHLFSFGWIGVDLFFVLSGFLIGKQVLLENSQNNYLQNLYVFWTKRWFRTLPLYFFILGLYIFIKPLITGVSFAPASLPFFFFMQNYYPLTDFVQSWSICIEEQFYILLPLITYLNFKKTIHHPLFWFILFLISIAVRFWCASYLAANATAVELDQNIRFPFYTHFDGLCAGVFLAASYSKWSLWSERSKQLLLLAGILLLIGTCYTLGPQPTTTNIAIYFTLLPVSVSLIIIGLKNKNLPTSISFIIQHIAILSYGAYLWNNLFIRLIVNHFPNLNPLIATLFFLALTFSAAQTTYTLIELPFLKLRSHKKVRRTFW